MSGTSDKRPSRKANQITGFAIVYMECDTIDNGPLVGKRIRMFFKFSKLLELILLWIQVIRNCSPFNCYVIQFMQTHFISQI